MGSGEPPSVRGTEFVSDVAELLERLDPLSARGDELWFRGHRNQSWFLAPSVFREPAHRKAETAMLARFRQEAATVGASQGLDEWGWLCFAQHHLLPRVCCTIR